jgi:hypothetical protein
MASRPMNRTASAGCEAAARRATRVMQYPMHDEAPASLRLCLSLYLNAHAELVDALHWTRALLLGEFDDQALVQAGPVDVPDCCDAIRRLLDALRAERRPSIGLVDETLRQCLAAQALCERVVAQHHILTVHGYGRSRHRLSSPEQLRGDAGKTMGLAVRVLDLHVLFNFGLSDRADAAPVEPVPASMPPRQRTPVQKVA